MSQRRASDENPISNSLKQDDYLLQLLKDQQTREEGFRLLMLKYQERIYWHVRKFVVEHEDANDIVQNTFVKAFRGIGRFKGKSKIYTWLYKIASNEAITWVNQKKRKQTSSLDEDGFGIANQLHADAFFDGNQAQLLLQQALGALPEKQRLVFNMKYFDEMTYQEMSEILDTSVGALKASYHHAVKKIERFFKDIEV